MRRKVVFKEGKFYHIFNKSIANFGIFRNLDNGLRFLKAVDYYNNLSPKINLGLFLVNNQKFQPNVLLPKDNNIVKFISYCVMPDHYHFLLRILIDDVFSKYIADVENSFTRFFNIKFDRKGPLWQSSFKAVRVKSNEQLLHLSRYIHLNPTTADLANFPEEWPLSSYKEFISDPTVLKELLTEISISKPLSYKKFVEDRKDYQKKLNLIKKLVFDQF